MMLKHIKSINRTEFATKERCIAHITYSIVHVKSVKEVMGKKRAVVMHETVINTEPVLLMIIGRRTLMKMTELNL